MTRKSLEIYRMCQNELPTSTLSKVIIWQTDRQAYTHTDRTEIIYYAALWVVNEVRKQSSYWSLLVTSPKSAAWTWTLLMQGFVHKPSCKALPCTQLEAPPHTSIIPIDNAWIHLEGCSVTSLTICWLYQFYITNLTGDKQSSIPYVMLKPVSPYSHCTAHFKAKYSSVSLHTSHSWHCVTQFAHPFSSWGTLYISFKGPHVLDHASFDLIIATDLY